MYDNLFRREARDPAPQVLTGIVTDIQPGTVDYKSYYRISFSPVEGVWLNIAGEQGETREFFPRRLSADEHRSVYQRQVAFVMQYRDPPTPGGHPPSRVWNHCLVLTGEPEPVQIRAPQIFR